jgi:hypothetical protein
MKSDSKILPHAMGVAQFSMLQVGIGTKVDCPAPITAIKVQGDVLVSLRSLMAAIEIIEEEGDPGEILIAVLLAISQMNGDEEGTCQR